MKIIQWRRLNNSFDGLFMRLWEINAKRNFHLMMKREYAWLRIPFFRRPHKPMMFVSELKLATDRNSDCGDRIPIIYRKTK